MKYAVTVSGRTFEIDVGGGTVEVDGRRVDAVLAPVPGTPLFRLALDGVTRTVALRRGGDGWIVTNGGEVWPVEVVDERLQRVRALTGAAAASGAGELVRAPMPGLVLRVEVAEGDPVQRGTGVVVLEAMKMENEIRASGEGRVARVLVVPGAAVEKGEPLVEIGAVS